MEHKVNTQRKVLYVALNFTEGLTDLTLYVRKPDGTTLDPIVMSEQGQGIYYATYIPDTIGIWQEKIVSSTNHDKIVRSIKVVEYDLSDVVNEINDNEEKIDAIQLDVDSIQSDVLYIKNKVNSIDEQINPGGYFI